MDFNGGMISEKQKRISIMNKIMVRSIKDIKECPFYTLTTKQRPVCLLKIIAPKSLLSEMSDNPVEFTDEEWKQNCGGEYKNCTIIPLFYENEEESEYNFVDQEVEDYNPFAASDKPLANIKIELLKIDNPYDYDTDVLVFPNNIDLSIDDYNLDQSSHGNIQKECDQIQRPIQMGMIYKTSNGGADSKIKAKCIYHAVVAGLSRLVSSREIKSATVNALYYAEMDNCEHVSFLPLECGTLNIDEVAMSQLSSIKEFMSYEQPNHIKKITILLPEQESYDSFTNYYNRIFKNV